MKRFTKAAAMLLSAIMVLSIHITVFAAPAEHDAVITILHTNDVHSRVDGDVYLASLLKKLKADGENVILISAGDDLHGQPLATISRGETIVDIMNLVGYNYMAPGNHDFNYGISRLLELEKDMSFKLLSANVVKSDTKEAAFAKDDVIEIAGVKLGLFGLSTPETVTKTNPKNVEGYDFEKPATVAAAEVASLKGQGADVIVGIGHLGLDEETAADERSDAVAAVDGIDVLIDGHSHTVLEEGKLENGTLIAQTGEYLNNIGIVRIYLKDKKVVDKTAELLETPTEETAESSDLASDEAVSALIDSLNEKNKEIASLVIGTTPVKLEGERENVRAKETNLTNLITAAMIDATGADVSIENGGGVRASIEAGPITKGDVLNVLPFGNFIVTIEVTGADLIAAIEHGVDNAPAVAAHLSQIGGASVAYDSSKDVGSRVLSITLDSGETVAPEKTYTVAVNDFMAAGGDNYTMFVGKKSISYNALDEALIDYINKGIDFTKIKMGRLVDKAVAVVAEPVEAAAASPTPTPPPETEPSAEPAKDYTVEKGDYLIKIAEKLNVKWTDIAKINNISSPYIIYPGDVLLIP
ncbi:MAG: 5'-nucleotidase C-terminal domain-containing protein [Clostridiales bacterium]|jgi:5'-nucleotidase|nr:5'-nucleotidase C-terminal domain-containing protein [Clostridiales bacterium]